MPAAADSHASISTASDAATRSASGSMSPTRAAPMMTSGAVASSASSRPSACAFSRHARCTSVNSKSIHCKLPRATEPRRHGDTEKYCSCSPCFGELREDGLEARGALVQVLRQHARRADDRHEIRIAVPPRHQMHVHVLEHARAGRLSEVHADVDAVRLVRLEERFLAERLQIRHLVQLLL